MNNMNYLVGDSRVRGLRDYVPRLDFCDIWSRPGARVQNMFELVDDLTILHHGESNTKAHFYFSVGICDITERLRGPDYEEVIFNSTQFQDRKVVLYQEIDRLASATRNQYAMPVFCTIYPLGLSVWNHHRLNTGRTNRLVHENSYSDMQRNLEIEIAEFNNYLVRTNINNGFTTPMMHRDLIHNRGRGRSIVRYNDLADGCHLNNSALLRCKTSLMVAYTKNKNRHRH